MEVLEPLIIPVVNGSLVIGVVIFVLRIVLKGTWLHRDVHLEIVNELKEKYQEAVQDRNYWRQQTMDLSGITSRALTATEKAVEHGNGGSN
jgi:hypothetical protein